MKGCELELGKGKNRIFLKIEFDPVKIWVDTKGLPQTAILCAMCDATEFIRSKVGEKGKQERYFVNIDWAINEWGGDKKIVEALKKRKQMILEDLPRLREKYGSKPDSPTQD